MTGARKFSPSDVVLLLALSTMWGLSFLFMELSLRELTPLWIVVGRTGAGAATLLVLLALRRMGLPNRLRVWGHLLVLGTINNAAPWTAIAWAQQTIPSGLAALLIALTPTSALIVSALAGLERITRARLAGLILALGGVAVIVMGDIEEPGRVAAVLVVTAATLSYAIGAVYTKTFVSGATTPMALACGQVLCATALALPFALLIDGTPPALTELTATTITAIVLLGTFGTGLAFYVFYILIARVGATNATLSLYLIPLVALIAGAVVLGERIALPALSGGGFIVIGIWLAQRSTAPGIPRNRDKSPAPGQKRRNGQAPPDEKDKIR